MAKEQTQGGVGFLGLLCLLFIALKLTGHIQWGWEWVLAPLWIPVVVLIGFVCVCLAVLAVIRLTTKGF